MKKTKITLNELLESQTHQGFRATLESVENHKDQVKITPFLPGGGCQCSIAIMMPKDSIESLDLTGETHYCCGKNLQVVEVKFKKGAGISPDALLEQLINNASHTTTPHDSLGVHPRGPLPPPNRNAKCMTDYENCLDRAQDEFDTCQCSNRLLFCMGRGGLVRRCPSPG